MNVCIEIVGGGEPGPEEVAALVMALETLVRPQPCGDGVPASPAASEWALQGRMADLHWAPIAQRWPGEPPGRSWRRVLS